jgi:hypothetical protein
MSRESATRSGQSERFLRLLPISPLSTGLLPKILLLRLGGGVHRGQVIGTAVPASSESRQRNEDAAGDQRSDLRRQALLKFLREWKRGQPGRGAGRVSLL